MVLSRVEDLLIVQLTALQRMYWILKTRQLFQFCGPGLPSSLSQQNTKTKASLRRSSKTRDTEKWALPTQCCIQLTLPCRRHCCKIRFCFQDCRKWPWNKKKVKWMPGFLHHVFAYNTHTRGMPVLLFFK